MADFDPNTFDERRFLIPLAAFELSKRSNAILRDYQLVGDMLADINSAKDFENLPGAGKGSLAEVSAELAQIGLTFQSQPPEGWSKDYAEDQPSVSEDEFRAMQRHYQDKKEPSPALLPFLEKRLDDSIEITRDERHLQALKTADILPFLNTQGRAFYIYIQSANGMGLHGAITLATPQRLAALGDLPLGNPSLNNTRDMLIEGTSGRAEYIYVTPATMRQHEDVLGTNPFRPAAQYQAVIAELDRTPMTDPVDAVKLVAMPMTQRVRSQLINAGFTTIGALKVVSTATLANLTGTATAQAAEALLKSLGYTPAARDTDVNETFLRRTDAEAKAARFEADNHEAVQQSRKTAGLTYYANVIWPDPKLKRQLPNDIIDYWEDQLEMSGVSLPEPKRPPGPKPKNIGKSGTKPEPRG